MVAGGVHIQVWVICRSVAALFNSVVNFRLVAQVNYRWVDVSERGKAKTDAAGHRFVRSVLCCTPFTAADAAVEGVHTEASQRRVCCWLMTKISVLGPR